MKTMRRIAWFVLAVSLALAMYFATLRAGWWASDVVELRAKYAAPPSRFLTVDGVPIHVLDEGSGPVVVMLHGSIASLHEWDLVAARLTDAYRVVRLDWPPYGLSGPDPSGEYSTARAAQLLAGVVAALQLPPFVLVATSNGGNVALEYNLHHAQMVRAIALSVLPLERPSQTRAVDWRLRALMPVHKKFLPDFHFRWWYRVIIEDTTSPGFEPTPAMVDMFYDMNNLPGAAQRQRQYIDSNTRLFKAGDVGSVVARAVTAPVLLQWCELDTVISQTAEDSVRRFVSAQVELVRYPDLGHFPMWEAPERFSADLRRFLDRVSQPATQDRGSTISASAR
jgi:pimeloyl-ACP methyl ester carboxylesterase